MKFNNFFILLLLLIGLIACRTEFERIRTSGDAQMIFEEANRLYEEGEYRKAVTLFELVIPAYRGKAEAEKLYFNFANAHFLDRRYILSAHYFKTFADTYTSSALREDALYNHAFSNYKQSPKYKLDQSNTQKAIDAFQLFVNTYPESERVSECNTIIDVLREKMELKAFDVGKLYFEMRNYSSAIKTFDNLLKDYPGSPKEEEAMYLIVKASRELALNSIFTKQEERYNETLDRCAAYLKKHVGAEHSKEVNNYKQESLEALNQIQNG
jgi:outer membrane protein assembly factor BamD